MWTSLKRTSCLYLSIKSELNACRGVSFWYIFALYVTFLGCLFRAHWYLVVICFPGLAEPKTETWDGPNSQTGKNQSETDKLQDQEADQGSKSPNDNTETQPATSASNHSDQADTATGSLNCVCVLPDGGCVEQSWSSCLLSCFRKNPRRTH